MFQRILEKNIKSKFFKGKIIIIAGARQTGKTTLVKSLSNNFAKNEVKFFNCDDIDDRDQLSNKNLEFLKQLIGDAKLIIIDEAQKTQNIGETLKLLIDYYSKKNQIIVTGSSSINLLDNTQEPLTGRKFVYNLFSLSLEEIYSSNNYSKLLKEIESLLVFGSYPEVVSQNTFEDKKEILKELASSYIYKDILAFQQIKNPDILHKLLKALALQIGSEVSYNELSNLIGISKNTVERYVDLLEKSFIIFRLSPFTKNKRKEISKLRKIYFYDVGIRNVLINNFNFMENRNDIGFLWENFMITERMKYRKYHKIDAEQYFWRTYEGQEIDLIEEKGSNLFGFEFKWKTTDRKKLPNIDFDNKIITKKNLKGFVF
ncbi:ATP-binding protein [Patescibacteria group bacterium]